MNTLHLSPSTVIYAVKGDVAWIRLNRPHALNSLNPQLIAELQGAFACAEADDAVRSIVVIGSGDAFCAGVDLTYARSLLERDCVAAEFLQPFSHFISAMRELSKPVVGAINGTCVGGGLEILLCCDVIISADGSMIGDGHVRYGLLPATGVARKLVQAMGHFRASQMLLMGQLYSANELQDFGLIFKIVPRAELEDAAAEAAASFSGLSGKALSQLKTMLRIEADMTAREASEFELATAVDHFASGIPEIGIKSFLSKATPIFD